MIRCTTPFAVALLALAGACAAPVETIQLPLTPTGWKVGQAADLGSGQGRVTQWIPEAQSSDDWREMVTIQLREDLRGRESDAVVTELFAAQAARDAHVESAVVEQDEWSVLYECVHADAPPENAARHELARMIEGEQGLHLIAYVRRGERLTEARREEWLAFLRAALVTADGRSLR